MIYFCQKKKNHIFHRKKKAIDEIRIVKNLQNTALIHLKLMFQSHRNHLINLHSKSIDWFLYDCYISFIGLHCFIRTNFKTTMRPKLVKKQDQLETFPGWKVQKQKIKTTMVNVSFKNLLRKERTEHCQGRLLRYNRIFCWGI